VNWGTVVEQDNKSALTFYGQGWSKSDRTRHISIKYSFITEQIGRASSNRFMFRLNKCGQML
jgi:hypothetical protein